MVREAGKTQRWSVVISISEMDQNGNYLDSGKAVYTLKTIFRYFSYLVIRIRRFLKRVVYIEYIY